MLVPPQVRVVPPMCIADDLSAGSDAASAADKLLSGTYLEPVWVDKSSLMLATAPAINGANTSAFSSAVLQMNSKSNDCFGATFSSHSHNTSASRVASLMHAASLPSSSAAVSDEQDSGGNMSDGSTGEKERSCPKALGEGTDVAAASVSSADASCNNEKPPRADAYVMAATTPKLGAPELGATYGNAVRSSSNRMSRGAAAAVSSEHGTLLDSAILAQPEQMSRWPRGSPSATAQPSSDRLYELLDTIDSDMPPPSADVRALSAELRSVAEAQVSDVPLAKLKALLRSVHPLIELESQMPDNELPENRREAQVQVAAKLGGGDVRRKTGYHRTGKGKMITDDEESDGREQDRRTDYEDPAAEHVVRSLDAALLVLTVLTLPSLPAELLVDEYVEKVLVVTKRGLKWVHAERSKPSNASPVHASTQGQRRVRECGCYDARSASGDDLTSDIVSGVCTADSLSPTTTTLTLLLERLPLLLRSQIADPVLHQLIHVGIMATFDSLAASAGNPVALQALQGSSAVGHFGCHPLHIAGTRILLDVFAEYKSLRTSIIHDILDAQFRAAFVTSREARHVYALPDGGHVQLFSALCLLLIQSSASMPPPLARATASAGSACTMGADASRSVVGPGSVSKMDKKAATRRTACGRAEEPTGPTREADCAPSATVKMRRHADGREPALERVIAEHPWHGVQRLISGLLKPLVSKCLNRPDEAEYRATLEGFVRDILLLVGRPEWPAAHIVVERLGYLLCQKLSTSREGANDTARKSKANQREETAARLVALEQLGGMLALLYAHKRRHAESPLIFPPPKKTFDVAAQPTDEGEVTACLCGQTFSDALGFMLDCDKCHRWFHGSCVGMLAADAELPDHWLCDNCRLSTAVHDQRQRIARFLSLSVDRDESLYDDENGCSPVASEAGLLCTENETTKQLLLNYLQNQAVADPAADSAQALILCEWHAEATSTQSTTLMELYQEQYAGVLAARRRVRSLPSSVAPQSIPHLLSRKGILSATRRLMSASGLFSKIDTMLSHLLLNFKDMQSSSRTKAIKALREIVKAEPETLAYRGVQQAVQAAMQDPSIAVREGTLDLLGNFLTARPEFLPPYYRIIVSHLADPGISVRKRVIKIIRELCVARKHSLRLGKVGVPNACASASASTSASRDEHPDEAELDGKSFAAMRMPSRELSTADLSIDACCRMVARLGPSEDEEVHKLILKTIHELWFAPPRGSSFSEQAVIDSGDTRIDGRSGGRESDNRSAASSLLSNVPLLSRMECRARCSMLIGVVTRLSEAAGSVGVHRCEWLGSMLHRMLHPVDGDGKNGANKDVLIATRVCEQLIAELIDSLLRLEERRQAVTSPEILGEAMHCLSLLCTAKPLLVVPHLGVIAHFLKHEHASKAIQHVCEMLPKLLRIVDHPPKSLLVALETYLAALVFRVPEPNLQYAIPALALTIRASDNKQLAFNILMRFYDYLHKFEVHLRQYPPTSPQQKLDLPRGINLPSVFRAMLCVGLLCHYYDFVAPTHAAEEDPPASDGNANGSGSGGGVNELSRGNVNELAYRLLCSLARPGLPPQVILYAYKGIGHMIVRRPELLVSAYGLVAHALAPNADSRLKHQMLCTLRMLLAADEERQRTLSAAGRSTPVRHLALVEMQRASETSALVTGSLQRHLSAVLAALLDPRETTVRHAALSLVGALLVSGLAHPAKILPKLLALEVDSGPGGTSLAAMTHLRQAFERHKEMLSSSSIALEGAAEAYALSIALRRQQIELRQDDPTDDSRMDAAQLTRVSFVYTLHSTSRKLRQAYLRALLEMLAPERYDDLKPSHWKAALHQCEWVAHCLGAMPYDREGDVLLIIYHANRLLSLHAESKFKDASRLLGYGLSETGTIPSRSALEQVVALALFKASRGSSGVSNADVGGKDGDDIFRGAEYDDEGCSVAGWAADLICACHRAALIGLTLALKSQLKRAYCLSDLRCQGFEPYDGGKPSERTIVKAANPGPMQTAAMWQSPLETQQVPASNSSFPEPTSGSSSMSTDESAKGSTAADIAKTRAKATGQANFDVARQVTKLQVSDDARLAAAQYLWLRSLMTDDDMTFDYNILVDGQLVTDETGAADSGSGGAAVPNRGGNRRPRKLAAELNAVCSDTAAQVQTASYPKSPRAGWTTLRAPQKRKREATHAS